MIEDKYNMKKEENVFFAKRNVVDSIWKSANLEGIAVTFPETQTIYDGANVAHLRIDEIQTINNLKHAWQYILASIDVSVNVEFIKSIHSLVGSNVVDNPGNLRSFEVSMGGTSWRPELPTVEIIEDTIKVYEEDLNSKSTTDAIITLMCKLMKMQIFNDGNKRTSMLVANHELIKNGKGIVSIADENKTEFGTKLIAYYEDENKLEELKEFICEKCLDGINA